MYRDLRELEFWKKVVYTTKENFNKGIAKGVKKGEEEVEETADAKRRRKAELLEVSDYNTCLIFYFEFRLRIGRLTRQFGRKLES